MTFLKQLRVLFFTVLGFASLSARAAQVELTGAGATFPNPIYQDWFDTYHAKNGGVKINYQSVGSGAGVKFFVDKVVDFGASDDALDDKKLGEAKAAHQTDVFHIPTVMGAVAVAYNVSGVATGLKLSPEVLSNIFLGKVTQWNDPSIQKLNSGIKLPNTAITVVHRSDGSGTTAVFTEYLSKVSSEWKEKVGAGKAVNWVATNRLGGKGNEQVSNLISTTSGSIGYTELSYVKQNNLSVVALQNKAGKFVEPSIAAISAAAAANANSMPNDLRAVITNAEGDSSYPISSFTYVLVPAKMNKAKGEALKSFLNWALNDGQKRVEKLHYAPLPDVIAKKAIEKVTSITVQ